MYWQRMLTRIDASGSRIIALPVTVMMPSVTVTEPLSIEGRAPLPAAGTSETQVSEIASFDASA